tara:strand:+ start:4460 stop:5242 length:783 start_codon:yes stop_codon:yes gene_type:complete
MKVAKSLVKKGGKKSLKKTLKMRKSKKGGKKSLKNRKTRKTIKGGAPQDMINLYKKNIDEYKKVYEIWHSNPPEEEKQKIDYYLLQGLYPKLVKGKECSSFSGDGHVYVGIEVEEGAPKVNVDDCDFQLHPKSYKIVEDPGTISMKKRYLFKAENPYIGSYEDFEFDASKFDSSNYYGGKKSLNTKKARKSRKMKGGELTMEEPPKNGECIKKGITGLRTYTVVRVNPSDGNYQPTVDVIDSSGMPHTFNLGEMVRCVAR